jgi:integrase
MFASPARHGPASCDRYRQYDLRHSFVSLLIAQGATVVEVARQAGHAPTMTLSTYAHLFDELADGDHRPAPSHRSENPPV